MNIDALNKYLTQSEKECKVEKIELESMVLEMQSS
jgi:hypothetical protein